MSSQVQDVVLNALMDLIDEEISTFKWHLSQKQLDSCKPVARCRLEKAQRIDIVSQLVSSYGPDFAVAVTVLILQKMNKNYTAQELQQEYAAVTSSSAASVVGPAPGALAGPGAPAGPGTPGGPGAPLTVSAQGSSVTVAPIVSGGTAGTWNINITR